VFTQTTSLGVRKLHVIINNGNIFSNYNDLFVKFQLVHITKKTQTERLHSSQLNTSILPTSNNHLRDDQHISSFNRPDLVLQELLSDD